MTVHHAGCDLAEKTGDACTCGAVRDAQEKPLTRYGVECPNCGEWHESEESYLGRPPFQCSCATWIKATP